MHRTLRAVVLFILAASPAFLRAADNYTVDAAHTSVTFKISHLGLSWTHGRFNEVSGSFVVDADPAKSSFTLNIGDGAHASAVLTMVTGPSASGSIVGHAAPQSGVSGTIILGTGNQP